MHQLQVAIEEERCKILQVDNRLEEILETSSYFVDRSQDILEVLTGRMERLEANEPMFLHEHSLVYFMKISTIINECCS